MSDSSQVRFAIGLESGGYGVTVASPTVYNLRFSSQSLKDSVGAAVSQNIRSDANIDDSSNVTRAVDGAVSCDFYADDTGALAQMVEAVVRGTKVASASASATAQGTLKTIVHASSWPATFAVGDIVDLSAAPTAANNGFAYITAISGATMTVQRSANFTTDETVTVKRLARISNAVVDRSFFAEVGRLDVSRYQLFHGLVFGAWDIAVTDGQITSCSFAVTGQSSERGSSEIASATFTAAPTTSVLDPLDVTTLYVGGVAYPAQSFRMNVNNTVAARRNAGTQGPIGVRRGRTAVTGSITAYFDEWTSFDELIDETESNIWWVMEDAAGVGWGFAIHRTKWTDADNPTAGPDSDEMKNLSFHGFYDEDTGCTVSIFRVD